MFVLGIICCDKVKCDVCNKEWSNNIKWLYDIVMKIDISEMIELN